MQAPSIRAFNAHSMEWMSRTKHPHSKARLAVRQARTVARQWSGVIAESLGVRRPTPQSRAEMRGFDPGQWGAAPLGAAWLGHATALLRIGGLNVLTDPHFDERAGVRLGPRKVGRRRAVTPPITPEELPPVDLLLLSHAHMDHWDTASLMRLSRQHWAPRTLVIIPKGTRRLLAPGFGDAVELDWDSRFDYRGVHIRAIRPRHWGARFVIDRRRGYNAYTLEGPSRRVVFGGDTAMTDAFDHLGMTPERGVDLAVMGIGSYEPWPNQHATPEQVAEMARRMGARLLMPVHHATFHDANVPLAEPLRRLRGAWDPDRIICPRIGDVWTVTDAA